MVNSNINDVHRKDLLTWHVKALEDLKDQGVKALTNVPWNGLN